MRLRTFLLLDLIGSLLWIALCVGLGYAIGQRAVDVAKGVSRYALYVTIVLIVVVFVRQYLRRAPHALPTIVPRTSPKETVPGRAAQDDRVAVGQERRARARSASPRCPASGRRSCPRRTGRPGARRRR